MKPYWNTSLGSTIDKQKARSRNSSLERSDYYSSGKCGSVEALSRKAGKSATDIGAQSAYSLSGR